MGEGTRRGMGTGNRGQERRPDRVGSEKRTLWGASL